MFALTHACARRLAQMSELSFGFGTRESVAAWGIAGAIVVGYYWYPQWERKQRHAAAKERMRRLASDPDAQRDARTPDASDGRR